MPFLDLDDDAVEDMVFRCAKHNQNATNETKGNCANEIKSLGDNEH